MAKRPRVEADAPLAARHGHPRDVRLAFDAAAHAYYWDGIRVPISVSGVWQRCFPTFDAAATIERCFDGWRSNPNSKYCALLRYLELVVGGGVAEQKAAVAQLWEAHRTRAADEGTALHAQIEAHLARADAPSEATAEWAQYLAWRAEWAGGWEPYRVEWAVHDDAANVGGMIDSVWRDADGRLVMVDWKRCKPAGRGGGGLSPDDKAYGGATGFGPCAALPDTAFYHYAVQQNLYAAILARNYGVRVHAMYLAQFHPRLKAFHCVRVPELGELAVRLLTLAAAGDLTRVEHSPAALPWPQAA